MNDILDNFDAADHDRSESFVEQKPSERSEQSKCSCYGINSGPNVDIVVSGECGTVVIGKKFVGTIGDNHS